MVVRPAPSSPGAPLASSKPDMKGNEAERTPASKEEDAAVSDWITGGPLGSKAAVLVFRSQALAPQTPSTESPTRTVGSTTQETSDVAVLEANRMPAKILHITYKLANTETKLLHRLLQAHGLTEADPADRDFSLLWSGLHPKPDQLRSLTQYQRVNHFPRSYELTRKDKLFKNIEKMQYFRGLKQFDFIPTTFLMPTEYKELCSTHCRTKGPWIVKPYALSRGRGIYIVNTPEQIPKTDNVVVAKYIDKPLLIKGHKCDLRLYVCVTSIDPLLIYLYEEGLVRFATVKYDKTNENLWNPCMHLCNYSINKYHTDYIKSEDANAGNIGHKWTLSALLHHLKKQGRNTSQLMASIEDLVVKSILSSAQTIASASRAFVPYHNNCFELFGYDILVDEMLKPWLLEINLSPSLACDSVLDLRVKSALLADTLTLVGVPAVRGRAEHLTSLKAGSLRQRIGACRRVHSAENVLRGKGGSRGTESGLTGEEARMVRAVKAQFERRGGYVRIFPAINSWQKYSQYLDPVSGIPVCSTSLYNGAPLSLLAHNHNLLVHAHVLPHTHNASLPDQPDRLHRYERATIAHSPPVSLGADPAAAAHAHDARRTKELIKQQLDTGMKLTRGEGRRAFGLFLTHVLKRLAGGCGGAGGSDSAATHAALVHRFLRRAALSLRMPYHALPVKMSDKDRCAVVSKQLSDFLYMYHRETDLYTDSEDQDGCVSNIHFSQFMHSASEADLEDVLLLVLKTEHQVTTFLGDGRNPFCIDVPAERLTPQSPRQHLLLRQLACLSNVNTRRYKPSTTQAPQGSRSDDEQSSSLNPELSGQEVVKESLMEEKTLTVAMRYARS